MPKGFADILGFLPRVGRVCYSQTRTRCSVVKHLADIASSRYTLRQVAGAFRNRNRSKPPSAPSQYTMGVLERPIWVTR
jgi:hypothetical protein